jgi:hypothetical protein
MTSISYQFNASNTATETRARRRRIRNRYNNMSHRRKIETRKTVRGGARFLVHNAAAELTIPIMPTIKAFVNGVRGATEAFARLNDAVEKSGVAQND